MKKQLNIIKDFELKGESTLHVDKKCKKCNGNCKQKNKLDKK